MRSIANPLLFICFLVTSCSSNLHIETIEIKDYGQFFNVERKSLFTLGHTVKIAFNEKRRLFIEERTSSTSKIILDNHGNTMDQVITKQDTSYMGHIFQTGSKNGLSYNLDSFNDEKGIVFNVDSLTKSLSLDDQNNLVLNMELGKPNEILREKDIEVEKFFFSKKKPSDPDSIYRYYDKRYRNIDFSFSEKLDKQKNSKLVKTLFIYNPSYVLEGSKKYVSPRRVMETSMARIDIKLSFLKEIFKKFEEDNKKLNLK